MKLVSGPYEGCFYWQEDDGGNTYVTWKMGGIFITKTMMVTVMDWIGNASSRCELNKEEEPDEKMVCMRLGVIPPLWGVQ